MFVLNQKLWEDTIEIARLKLSLVLLMKDRSFPWLILVPEREGVREIYELSAEDRGILIEEISLVSQVIERLYKPDKINVGALGNMVPQLHIHIVGRFRTDRAWPGPVWGTGPAEPYSEEELKGTCEQLREILSFQLK